MARPKDEFTRISTYFAPLAAGFDGAYNLQDDAATIITKPGFDLVITTDTIVETIHFLGHESPSDIAHKLIAVNFSDLASKGAMPFAYTLNLSLPPQITDDWLAEFCEELAHQQNAYNCHLIGGDSVGMPAGAPITLSITAFGEVKSGQMLKRSTAKVGDLICVSGTIGDGALGLLAAREGFGLSAEDSFLKNRYYRPIPRLPLGVLLHGVATASMDVSDGLLADLGHLAFASNVGAEINIANVPLSNAALEVIAADPDLMELVLTGGDDYELLFTIDSTDQNILETLAKQSETALSVIGTIKEGAGVKALDRDGQEILFAQTGFRHS